MEEWQKDQITNNLSSLINCTTVNALLLAELRKVNVLSVVDVAKIVVKKTNSDQAKLLYNILVTKAHGYFTLIKALHKTRQSTATSFLPLFHPSQPISNLKVKFQGKSEQLKNILTTDQVKAIETWLLESDLSEYVTKAISQTVSEKKTVHLLRNTIPKACANYIPRYVSVPQFLDPCLFRQFCPDIFVFKNIKRSILIDKVATYKIASSTRFLLQKKLSCRFIILDSEKDWSEICAKADAGTPVHLINYELKINGFLLEATTGGSEILQEHFKYKHCNHEYVSEEDLIEHVLEDDVKIVCISDSPGMGKSELLASFARRIKKKCPKDITCFIQGRDFVQELEKHEDKMKAILEHISTSKLASRILYELTKQGNIKFNMFFDGIDELQGTLLESMNDFIPKIFYYEIIEGTRLFVTSHRAVYTELEKAYWYMLPFDEEAQVTYLQSYWIQNNPTSDTEKLNEFATFIVQKFAHTFKPGISIISGVPLQCKLIAELYSNEAAIFADTNSKCSKNLPTTVVDSLFEVYSKFMVRRLGESKCRFACMHKAEGNSKVKCDANCKVKSFHVLQALGLVCGDLEIDIEYSKYFDKFSGLKPSQILAPGILKPGKRKHTFDFLHKTIAEYLVAEYIAKILLTKQHNSPRRKLFDKILSQLCLDRFLDAFTVSKIEKFSANTSFEYHSFNGALLPYFLNESITECLHNKDKICVSVLSSNYASYSNPVQACLQANYQGILKVLFHGIQHLEKSTNSWLNRAILATDKDTQDKNMLALLNAFQTAARFSDIVTIDQLFQFLENGVNFDLTKLSEFETTCPSPLPMQVAVKRGDYQVVEYLANKFSLENQGLLYWCFKDTYGEDEKALEMKIEIAKLLLSKHADLITEESIHPNSDQKRAIIITPKIHLKALRFLVEKGINVKTNDKSYIKIYIEALNYMTEEDFEKLKDFLFVDCEAQKLFADPKNYKIYFCQYELGNIVSTVLRYVDNMIKITIKDKSQDAKFELLRSNFFKDMFFRAVATGHVEIVAFFLDQDTAFLELRHSGQHLRLLSTCNYRRMEYKYANFEMLASEHIKMEQNQNVTPILMASKYGQVDMIKFLVNRGANIFAVDAKSRTILHLAAISTKNEAFQQIVSCIGMQIDKTLTIQSRNSDREMEPKSITELFNWRDNEENTPLHEAIKYIALTNECLNLFLACGRESKPLTIGERFQSPNAINSVNTNAVNKLGQTALHIALFSKRMLEAA